MSKLSGRSNVAQALLGLGGAVVFRYCVWFLRRAEPRSFCAYCGAFLLFWGGVVVAPRQYFLHKTYYDALFFVPYLVVGIVITLCGCYIAPAVVRRFRTQASPTALAFFSTLCALSVAAIASDVCGQMRLWPVPLFLLHGGYDSSMILSLSEVFLPAAVMSAFLEFCDRGPE